MLTQERRRALALRRVLTVEERRLYTHKGNFSQFLA
jgi:hypothetical protein